MRDKAVLLCAIVLLVSLGLAFFFSGCQMRSSATAFAPTIPTTWDDMVMQDLELPLAHAPASPKHVSSNYYYRIPVRPILKSYPVYHPDREPPDYLDRLRQHTPEVVWDGDVRRPSLRTEEDWIQAGELVFDSPLGYGQIGAFFVTNTNLYVRDPKWLAQVKPAVARDGTLPFFRYVVRERGKVEIGVGSCAACHSRVMPDGSVIKGAQGNVPGHRAQAAGYRFAPKEVEWTRMSERILYFAPGFPSVDQSWLDRMNVEEFAALHEVIPPGVLARHRTSPYSPVQVPDLVGVRERRYLDRTGLQHHRGIADLMRYAALNQGGDDLADFAGFTPMALVSAGGKLPTEPKDGGLDRYSDEQLYALALYLYSLKPRSNPNLPKTTAQKALVQRGEEIFNGEGCFRCHDPKQGYTNNKLVAAPGYEPPADHPAKDDILRTPSGTLRRVGTDPTLTLATRRGTGFYKVPSLRGVWYRGPFEHNGSCATLEDWFNPARTNDTFVPTGWPGPPGTKTRAVKGHEYGLDLSEDARKALIAFLRTL